MDPSVQQLLAQRISTFPPLAPLPSLNSDVIDRKGWDGKSYMAFYKMAVIVLRELIPADAMLCWYDHSVWWIFLITTRISHCRYIRYLLKVELTDDNLRNMMATYWQWKSLFIKLYKSQESSHNAVSKKNMNFVNLHIGEHWPYTIKMFGVPIEYSTQHWESLHQQVKRKEKTSNHKKPSQDIAKMIINETAIKRSYGKIEVCANIISGCKLTLSLGLYFTHKQCQASYI